MHYKKKKKEQLILTTKCCDVVKVLYVIALVLN